MRIRLLAASAASILFIGAACSDSSGPKIGPPAKVEVVTSPTTTGAVKGSLGTFAVKVSDASSQAVSGVAVTFAANGGGGIVLTPTSATTDATGTARTSVVLGTLAGSATITASVTGVTTAASVSLTTTAGDLARVTASPKTIKLGAVGDTARIAAQLQDAYSNAITGTTLSYSIGDPTLISVDAAGLIRALRVGGTTSVVASANGTSDSVTVSVIAPGSSPCTGFGAPATLAVGGMVDVSGATICLGGGTAQSDYTIIAYNKSTDGSLPLSASIVANGVSAPPSGFLAGATGPLAVRSPSGGTAAAAPVLDESFHMWQLEQSRKLRGLFSSARRIRAARLAARTTTSSGGFSLAPSYSSIPASAAVGDLVKLNASGTSVCDNPLIRTFMVKAIGTKSMVLADTLNPTGGFTDADYGRFAARFDTLVYPLDVGNFGAPSDLDGNGKVAILFTKAVNELTSANSTSFVGGFFFARDLFPKLATPDLQACASSNEGEMFYMLVPDPTGAVNGNKHTVGFVDTLTTGILAHEFQHLINASRRLYVNTTAEDFEDKWLDEGLAHSCEELLYYRESGKQPRQHYTDADIRVNSRPTYPLWKADAASNFQRFIEYLRDPGSSSPIDEANDELSTRGASWSFLRYAIDRTFTSDAGVFTKFGNSTTTGLGTVSFALGTDPQVLLRDYALTNYLGDLGIPVDPKYLHPSWNFRDIFSNTFINLGYPLKLTPVADNTPAPVSVKGSSASYYRLGVPAASQALVTFSSGQGAPNSSFRFTLVRTK
jgi:hypothetical protein